jgi:translation initiation factor IF-2
VGKIDLEIVSAKKETKLSVEKQQIEFKEQEKASKKKAKEKTVEEDKKDVIEVISTVKEVEKNLPRENEKEISETAKPKEEEIFRVSVLKTETPTILGKIDLPTKKEETKKPQPIASSDSGISDKKKKRKRIRKEKEPIDGKSIGQTTYPKRGGKESGFGTQKSSEGTKSVSPEVKEEQIQKQIRETLARLTPKGKSKSVKYRKQKRDAIQTQMQEEQERLEEEKKILRVTEFVSANELAKMMSVNVNDVISACLSLGLFVSINQRLDAETLSIVAEEFGYKIEIVGVEDLEVVEENIKDKEEDLLERAPIVTVMGHVDHGKTSLLDKIRNEDVVAGEAGGITQHIGAYAVTLGDNKKITFLDTPGHEAFTAMRARGAKVTDIAIIVIAADDSVMPQTKEAINHAQAANVPIVFAFNKIDKPGANADKIRESLANMNLLVEEWGGKYQTQEISAKKGLNIHELLEKVLLEAELLNLKANPNRSAKGTVIESSLDKGRGYTCNILVQTGTLKIGDIVLAGPYSGRVKAMFNERNQPIKEAGPSTPIMMLGLNGAPQAGDIINVMQDEKEAREIATKRLQLLREQGMRTQKHITLDEIGRRIAIGDFKELKLIVKGDVDGSVEALTDSLLKLSTPKIQVNVIHKSVGQITESDVLLASASDAIILGFNVRPSLNARKLAEKEQIDIRNYSIIYKAIEEIKDAIEGMLGPTLEEKIVCNIEVREVFQISKVGTVAGCYVLDGKITRNTNVRVLRDGVVAYTGELGSLKRFKDDVKDVTAGYECGLNINNFNDIKAGDIIEGFEQVEVQQKLKI